jgi:hypothetical protein
MAHGRGRCSCRCPLDRGELLAVLYGGDSVLTQHDRKPILGPGTIGGVEHSN